MREIFESPFEVRTGLVSMWLDTSCLGYQGKAAEISLWAQDIFEVVSGKNTYTHFQKGRYTLRSLHNGSWYFVGHEKEHRTPFEIQCRHVTVRIGDTQNHDREEIQVTSDHKVLIGGFISDALIFPAGKYIIGTNNADENNWFVRQEQSPEALSNEVRKGSRVAMLPSLAAARFKSPLMVGIVRNVDQNGTALVEWDTGAGTRYVESIPIPEMTVIHSPKNQFVFGARVRQRKQKLSDCSVPFDVVGEIRQVFSDGSVVVRWLLDQQVTHDKIVASPDESLELTGYSSWSSEPVGQEDNVVPESRMNFLDPKPGMRVGQRENDWKGPPHIQAPQGTIRSVNPDGTVLVDWDEWVYRPAGYYLPVYSPLTELQLIKTSVTNKTA